MPPESVPSREALESQARQLLELARKRTGASVERMVKTFGEFQPRGAETRRSWYDWQERPETVSLLTGLSEDSSSVEIIAHAKRALAATDGEPPHLLVVDDAQRLDVGSAALLQQVVTRSGQQQDGRAAGRG